VTAFSRALIVLLAALTLAACGRKAPPQPPGPAGVIIYPRVYPAR
jgi:predicted small lipoprotein YifL